MARGASPGLAQDASAGSDLVARGLRDAGLEVIYGPSAAGADELAQAVLQEDADAVVLDSSGGAGGAAALSEALAGRGIEDVLVVAIEGDGAEVVDRIVRGLGVDGES